MLIPGKHLYKSSIAGVKIAGLAVNFLAVINC
jgi:hypothetical protein